MTEGTRFGRIDPGMRKILDVIGYDQGAGLASRSISDSLALLRSAPPPAPAGLAARYEDRQLNVGDRQIGARICWPEGEGPLPILLNFHGGGWVTGSIAGDDLRCQRLTVAAGCITVSVDFRLAPEHPFPGAFQDCRDACRWVFEHAQEIHGDPARIAVSGASAGANLAAAVAVWCRSERLPYPIYQLLFYPALDATARGGNVEGGPYGLTRAAMDWYWARYLPVQTDRTDPLISPSYAQKEGLPPATVITAELDPLAVEGRAYALALASAGVAAEHVDIAGVVHGFVTLAPHLPQTLDAIAIGAAALRRIFDSGTDQTNSRSC